MPIDSTRDLTSNPRYMVRILEIAKRKLAELSTDPVMKFALNSLWNLTDESPQACDWFVRLDGVKFAVCCLTVCLRLWRVRRLTHSQEALVFLNL